MDVQPNKSTRTVLLRQVVKFLSVGVINTLIGIAIMYGLYNLFHAGYWASSAVSYTVGGIVSYFLNRKITFQYKGSMPASILKFAVTVAACYLIAYSIAKPMITHILASSGLEETTVEQIAMFAGMCVYVGLNFTGQKLFAFRIQK